MDTAPIKWEPIARRKRDNRIVLKPVHPSAAIRIWYERCLQDELRAMHRSMLCHLAATWKDATPTIGFAQDQALALDDANPAVALRRTLNRWGRQWISKFNAMSDELARKFASRNFKYSDNAMRAALKDAGFTVAFRPSPASVEAYQAVVTQNVAQIRNIPQAFLNDIQNSVFSAVMRGGDLATLSKDLQKNYGVSYRRAAIIARTEVGRGKALIESVRRKELGLTTAIWLHSGGGRTQRRTHLAMNGKKFDVTKGFYDSDEDKFVLPGELINCRCVSKAVIEGFND